MAMNKCALCGGKLQIDRYFRKDSTCPDCGGDLHICLNCEFFDRSKHNKCAETRAEFQRVRDKANFCEFFRFRKGGVKSPDAASDAKEEARKKLRDIFGD